MKPNNNKSFTVDAIYLLVYESSILKDHIEG